MNVNIFWLSLNQKKGLNEAEVICNVYFAKSN